MTTSTPSAPRSSVTPWWIGVPLLLYLAHVWLYLRYVNDDAYITFRYSRFLASGLGPYFNVGEHVEGYTNFLQMVLMAAVFAVAGEQAVPLAAKLLGILCGGASLVLAFVVGRRLAAEVPAFREHAHVLAGLATGLVAVFPGYGLNATSGLETTLFGLLLLGGVHLSLTQRIAGRWRGAGILWSTAALTRPEGATIFAVHWGTGLLARLWARRRGDTVAGGVLPAHAIADIVCVVLVVGSHFALRYLLYEGELLPNTYYAKAGGLLGLTPWGYIRGGALAPFFGAVGVGLGVAGWWRLRPLLPLAAPLLALAVGGAGLPWVVGPDWMLGWRFAVPFLPALAIVVVFGWFAWLTPWLERRRLGVAVLAFVAVATLAVIHQDERRELRRTVNLRADGYDTGHRSLARWLCRDASGAGGTVALMDIGIVGYDCPEIRILDVTGLTDRTIAKSPGTFLRKEYDPAYVFDQQPEFIVLVLWAPGDPNRELPEDAALTPWTRTEQTLNTHPEFFRHYLNPRREAPAGAPWLDRLAGRLGATIVFEHAHPGVYYLLAVYQRR